MSTTFSTKEILGLKHHMNTCGQYEGQRETFKCFLENFQEKERSQLVSGNFDGFGTDDHDYWPKMRISSSLF